MGFFDRLFGSNENNKIELSCEGKKVRLSLNDDDFKWFNDSLIRHKKVGNCVYLALGELIMKDKFDEGKKEDILKVLKESECINYRLL